MCDNSNSNFCFLKAKLSNNAKFNNLITFLKSKFMTINWKFTFFQIKIKCYHDVKTFFNAQNRENSQKDFPPEKNVQFSNAQRRFVERERENKKELFYWRHNKITLWPPNSSISDLKSQIKVTFLLDSLITKQIVCFLQLKKQWRFANL